MQNLQRFCIHRKTESESTSCKIEKEDDKMKILFLCKYNRFRSRVAEAYFKKINKNKKIKVESAGIIPGNFPLSKEQIKAAKEFGIDIRGKIRGLDVNILRNNNLIIIVANDVPKKIFFFRGKYRYNIRIWKIPDVTTGKDMEGNKKAIRLIIKEVDKLANELKNLK
jgi:protein-tyrosine-phosphatase